MSVYFVIVNIVNNNNIKIINTVNNELRERALYYIFWSVNKLLN